MNSKPIQEIVLRREVNIFPGPTAGDVGSSSGAGDSDAGAAGPDSGSITLSKGATIAIIVCAVSVCVFGSGFCT